MQGYRDFEESEKQDIIKGTQKKHPVTLKNWKYMNFLTKNSKQLFQRCSESYKRTQKNNL